MEKIYQFYLLSVFYLFEYISFNITSKQATRTYYLWHLQYHHYLIKKILIKYQRDNI